MNQVLQLKGRFEQRKNLSTPGPANLPVGTSVNVNKIQMLRNQLQSIYSYWEKDTTVQGALISVHYTRIVAKSNRLQGLLGHQNGNPSDTVCGSRYSSSYNRHHIFTHYVQLEDLLQAIERLSICEEYIKKAFGDKISAADLAAINEKKIPYTNTNLARSNFAKVIVDCYYVNRFDIDRNMEPMTEPAIITIYKTNVDTQELFANLGIDIIDAEMIDDTTLRLNADKLEILRNKAPYLIAMQVNDISKLVLEDLDDHYDYDDAITIPSPSNEPIIGVIDTPFDSSVYFHEWVSYENYISKDIEIDPQDYVHGTEVSSIIVDGPAFNNKLEDGCGRFRVRHFGVAKAGRFSSFSVLKAVREIVAKNRDIKVWNFSLGSVLEINQNFISPEAAELDDIQSEYDVIFVVAGTNRPKDKEPGMKIGAPADSLNSIVVNSVTRDKQAASYYRCGPVLSFFNKPDLSYYGGDTGDLLCVCAPKCAGYVSGTSFSAPWISRKLGFLIYKMGLSRETAKALLIDAAAGWDRMDDSSHSIGFGVAPISIKDILNTHDDEIRFIMNGSSEEYETYTYNIPVPIVNNKYPFYARATLCYFPKCKRTQGVDYTNTEMDIHFGRVGQSKEGAAEIVSINDNRQGDAGIIGITEQEARLIYRKWDNVKLISETIKDRRVPKKVYEAGMWGLSIKTKERLSGKRNKGLQFGVVVTLKEMKGVNRIDDFIKMCMMRGWIVNRLDVDAQLDIYTKAEEDITFE